MSEFEVRVIGSKPPRRSKKPNQRPLGRLRRIAKAAFLRPRLVIAGGVAAVTVFVGTPHIGLEYECRHPMHGPGTCRSVSWCAYYGVLGRRVEFPEAGESCTLISVLPLDWDQLFGGRDG